MMNLKTIINDNILCFILTLSLIGCCKCKKYSGKVNEIDTIISLDGTTVIKQNDSIVILWEKTANARCKPIPTLRNEKKNILSLYLKNNLKNRNNSIEILNYKLTLNRNLSNDSLLVYENKYTSYINYEVIRSIKIKHRIMTLDFRDRKMFYGIMNYIEEYLGSAKSYSIQYLHNETNRELAHCVLWEINKMQIIIEDKGLSNCLQNKEQKHILFFKIKKMT